VGPFIHRSARSTLQDRALATPRGARVLEREAALRLLARSIEFGNGPIAVVRLVMAIHAGAEVPDAQWNYCHRVMKRCSDAALHDLFDPASRQHMGC
jgi:hypothetical protein